MSPAGWLNPPNSQSHIPNSTPLSLTSTRIVPNQISPCPNTVLFLPFQLSKARFPNISKSWTPASFINCVTLAMAWRITGSTGASLNLSLKDSRTSSEIWEGAQWSSARKRPKEAPAEFAIDGVVFEEARNVSKVGCVPKSDWINTCAKGSW